MGTRDIFEENGAPPMSIAKIENGEDDEHFKPGAPRK
jgi:hypothetical protein